MDNIHPVIFKLNMLDMLVAQVGKSYRTAEYEDPVWVDYGNGPDTFDCSGLGYYCLKNVGINLADRSSQDFYDELFTLDGEPVWGPTFQAYFSGTNMATITHMAFVSHLSTFVIHSIDDNATLGDGVVISRTADYIEEMISLGLVTEQRWIAPYTLHSLIHEDD